MVCNTPRYSDDDEPEQRAGELGVGSYHRHNPYDGLTDPEADRLLAELVAVEARRLPFGFRGRSV